MSKRELLAKVEALEARIALLEARPLTSYYQFPVSTPTTAPVYPYTTYTSPNTCSACAKDGICNCVRYPSTTC